MKSAKDPLGLYPETGETLGDLMYKVRNHCKASGIEGFAVPDPTNPGAYFVYGPHRLLGCVTTEMGGVDLGTQLLNPAVQ